MFNFLYIYLKKKLFLFFVDLLFLFLISIVCYYIFGFFYLIFFILCLILLILCKYFFLLNIILFIKQLINNCFYRLQCYYYLNPFLFNFFIFFLFRSCIIDNSVSFSAWYDFVYRSDEDVFREKAQAFNKLFIGSIEKIFIDGIAYPKYITYKSSFLTMPYSVYVVNLHGSMFSVFTLNNCKILHNFIMQDSFYISSLTKNELAFLSDLGFMLDYLSFEARYFSMSKEVSKYLLFYKSFYKIV